MQTFGTPDAFLSETRPASAPYETQESPGSKGSREEPHPSPLCRLEPEPGISIPRNRGGACPEGNAVLPGTSHKSGLTRALLAAETARHRRQCPGELRPRRESAVPAPCRFC